MENMEFEEALKSLEEIVRELESGEVSLEESMNKYTKAMELVKFCSQKLQNATETVNKIVSENGTVEDFNSVQGE